MKEKILGKSFEVSLNRFIEPAGRNPVDSCQSKVHNRALSAHG